jgi:hypothetical protein
MLQLNKELIDLFSISYNNQDWHFKKLEPDSSNTISGFVNVLYKGRMSLYVKYKKQLVLPTINEMYYSFTQVNSIYLSREGQLFKVNTKGELLNFMKDQKQQIRNFIRSNRITITRNNPESFRSVVEFYDKLPN